MNYFSALCTYLRDKADLLKVRPEQLFADIDGTELKSGSWTMTEDGIHAMDFHYDGIITIEQLPGNRAATLFLLIMDWLAEHDELRWGLHLPGPTPTLVQHAPGNDIYYVMVEIPFVDRFFLAADPDGYITIDGTTYGLGDHTPAIAETGTVEGAPV